MVRRSHRGPRTPVRVAWDRGTPRSHRRRGTRSAGRRGTGHRGHPAGRAGPGLHRDPQSMSTAGAHSGTVTARSADRSASTGTTRPVGHASRGRHPLRRFTQRHYGSPVRTNLTVEDLGDLLDRPLVAVLATLRTDGTVLLSPVYHEWRDGGFNIWVERQNVKARHLRHDPRA